MENILKRKVYTISINPRKYIMKYDIIEYNNKVNNFRNHFNLNESNDLKIVFINELKYFIDNINLTEEEEYFLKSQYKGNYEDFLYHNTKISTEIDNFQNKVYLYFDFKLKEQYYSFTDENIDKFGTIKEYLNQNKIKKSVDNF